MALHTDLQHQVAPEKIQQVRQDEEAGNELHVRGETRGG